MQTKDYFIIGFVIVAVFISAATNVKVNNLTKESVSIENRIEVKEVEFQTFKLKKMSMLDSNYELKIITKSKDGKNYEFLLLGNEEKKEIESVK